MDIEKTIRALTGRGFAVQHFATGREAWLLDTTPSGGTGARRALTRSTTR